MAKQSWFPKKESDRRTLLNNLADKLPGVYATKYGITTDELTTLGNFRLWFNCTLDTLEYIRLKAQGYTGFRDALGYGKGTPAGPLTPPQGFTLPAQPSTGTPPNTVIITPLANGWKFTASLVNRIKGHAAYLDADGQDLGIIGAEEDSADPETTKPDLKLVRAAGGHIEVQWKKSGFTGVRIEVDRGNGQWVFLTVDTEPHYVDTVTLAPAPPRSGNTAPSTWTATSPSASGAIPRKSRCRGEELPAAASVAAGEEDKHEPNKSMKQQHRRANWLGHSLASIFVILAAAFQTEAAEYSIIDLGPGQASAINNMGQVVGAKLITIEDTPAYLYQTEFWQAALWSTNSTNAYVRYDLGWSPLALGWLTNRLFTNWTGRDSWPIASYANSINDSGYITGVSTDEIYQGLDELELTAYTYGMRAFLWTPVSANATTGSMTQVPSLETYGDSLWIINGNGINNSNILVGGSQFDTDTGVGFDYNVGTDTLQLYSTGSPNFLHYKHLAINNAGTIAGEIWSQGQWDENEQLDPDLFILHTAHAGGVFLGTLMGTNWLLGACGDSSALAINNSNMVVGCSWYAPNSEEWPDGQYRACLWTNLSPASIYNIGVLSTNDTWSKAYSVSDSGTVVGSSWGSEDGLRAFVYENTNGMRDLNGLIPSATGWSLKEAKGINNSGWIVGYGTVVVDPCTMETAEHAFLLIPNP